MIRACAWPPEGGAPVPVPDWEDHHSLGRTVWLHSDDPAVDLPRLAARLELHELAVEDACSRGERTKLDRYGDVEVLTVYATHLDRQRGDVVAAELTALVGERWLVTVGKDPGFPLEEVAERWGSAARLADAGGLFLLWGLLDVVADSHDRVAGALDDVADRLEEALFAPGGSDPTIRQRTFDARRGLIELRRAVAPLPGILGALLRRLREVDSDASAAALVPYLQDVRDHVVATAEAVEALRDVLATILDTDATLRGDRLNEVMRRLTGWAAILAVPTVVTGFYGMNVRLFPPGGSTVGFYLALGLILVGCLGLWWAFRSRDWL